MAGNNPKAPTPPPTAKSKSYTGSGPDTPMNADQKALMEQDTKKPQGDIMAELMKDPEMKKMAIERMKARIESEKSPAKRKTLEEQLGRFTNNGVTTAGHGANE